MRHGRPIQEVRLHHPADPGISYAQPFREYEAAVAAGLDLWKWESGGYPPTFMARVVAWKDLRDHVSAHVEDARNEASERLAKQQAKKRR